MAFSLKQTIKTSPWLQKGLSLPLRLRRHYLREKYKQAFGTMKNLADIATTDIEISVPEFGGRFTLSPRSSLFKRCVIYGFYEPEVSKMFLEHIIPSRDVIDIGANVGFYTIGSALRLTSGRILAIEPTMGAYRRLQENVKANQVDGKVILERVIAADAPGEFKMNVVDGNEEYASIDNSSPSVEGGGSPAETAISACTIDSLVTRHCLNPALIKIDVEGAEMKVVLGAMETLRRFKPSIMAECSDAMLKAHGSSSRQLVELLLSLGYTLINPECPTRPVRQTIPENIFCIHTEKTAIR